MGDPCDTCEERRVIQFRTQMRCLGRLKKDMVMRVNQVAAEFRKVSNKQMAETTKRTIRENVSINAQLAKMSDKTMELIQENDELKQREKQQKQHIEMLEVNEKELAKKNISNQKVGRGKISVGGTGWWSGILRSGTRLTVNVLMTCMSTVYCKTDVC